MEIPVIYIVMVMVLYPTFHYLWMKHKAKKEKDGD